ncbi:MAG TPA: glycoside hydrolase family 2 TIM barrel-domain containing protein [Pyrinomonadaceae bacterium]|nr:glycoside hydrolase family 2 TIM barrel-domain containing protein [Pyrinomonadaceae bacterium]
MKLITISLILVIAVVNSAAQVRSSSTEIRYLSGTGKDDAVLWDFFCSEGRNSGVWSKIPVPSNWELQGFGAYQYGGDRQRSSYPKEQGKYKLNFSIPQRWRNRIVRLVFEGSMTDTEVWINGKSAGPIHQGSFYRFKYDITPLLKFGETNLLEVTVSKESSNTSVNNAERLGDYWNFGGIFRPVNLQSLPTAFIDWTAIDAQADGSFSINVNIDGQLSDVSRVEGQIIEPSGRPVGSSFSADIDTDQRLAKLQTSLSQPRLWTAETPNLYRVRLSLIGKSGTLHNITERFGFRTFEVRKGDGLYLNGQRILLKGINRHSFWPDSGRTLSRQISIDDVHLIKSLNMNAVRMSHYPPDVHFLEICDELGLYVLDELAGWQRSYDTATGQRLIRQMIQRDVNHPSILFWDNGNEGGWNTNVDDEFAKWDLQKREVLHPWEKFRLVNTDHYEKFDSHTRLSNGPDIYMPTEFLHGLYDGGMGAGLFDYWELIRRSKIGGGGFLWALLDECVKRTDQNGKLDCAGNRAPDGIVGPYREKEGSVNTVREIWSPIVVHGDPGAITLENRYDFTNLNQCKFSWELAQFPKPTDRRAGHAIIASGNLRAPDIAAHDSGSLKLSLPPTSKRADVLYFIARDQKGNDVMTWSWELNSDKTARSDGSRQLQMRADGDLVTVQNGAVSLSVNRRTGMIERVMNRNGSLPISNGPRIAAYRRNNRKYDSVAGVANLREFQSRLEADTAIIEAAFDGVLRNLRWRISADGASGLRAQLDYEYSLDGVVDILGIQFSSVAEQIRSLHWLGMGPYRVWQNRLQGTTLDVFQNEYNESTPGERWIFPEFKGYFRDLHWARFETREGPFTISTTARRPYLGLFKPNDGVNGLLDFPDVGIAILDVIPAMRNKFHTTEEIGPQSKAQEVSGVVKRSIEFKF